VKRKKKERPGGEAPVQKKKEKGVLNKREENQQFR